MLDHKGYCQVISDDLMNLCPLNNIKLFDSR
jgi:hypothetical protein